MMGQGRGDPPLFILGGTNMAYAGYFVIVGFLGALWLALDG